MIVNAIGPDRIDEEQSVPLLEAERLAGKWVDGRLRQDAFINGLD